MIMQKSKLIKEQLGPYCVSGRWNDLRLPTQKVTLFTNMDTVFHLPGFQITFHSPFFSLLLVSTASLKFSFQRQDLQFLEKTRTSVSQKQRERMKVPPKWTFGS